MEFLTWNQLPYRDRAERFSKIGSGFSKMLNTIKNDMTVQTSVRSRMRKIGDISESLTEQPVSRVDDRVELTNQEA